MNDVQWVNVFSSTNLIEIEIIRGMLSEEGIESVIINKQDSNYLIGSIELFVPTESAFLSQQLIKNTIV